MAAALGLASGCKDEPQQAEPADVAPVAAMTGPGQAATLEQADRLFLQQAAAAGAFETEAAEIAVERSLDPGVRDFAQLMIRDHTQLGLALRSLAARKNISLPEGPMPEDTEALQRLRTQTSGEDYDEDYAELMAERHDAAIDLYQRVVDSSADADIRDFARSALEILQRHRAAVDEIDAARVP